MPFHRPRPLVVFGAVAAAAVFAVGVSAPADAVGVHPAHKSSAHSSAPAGLARPIGNIQRIVHAPRTLHYDAATRARVRVWQKKHHVAVTGVWGRSSEKVYVRSVQHALAWLKGAAARERAAAARAKAARAAAAQRAAQEAAAAQRAAEAAAAQAAAAAAAAAQQPAPPAAPAVTLSISGGTAASGISGGSSWSITLTPVVTGAPAAATSWTASGMPTGLIGTTAADGSFTLAGTPTESGVFPITVTASNAGAQASTTTTLTVSPSITISDSYGGYDYLVPDGYVVSPALIYTATVTPAIAPGQDVIRWTIAGVPAGLWVTVVGHTLIVSGTVTGPAQDGQMYQVAASFAGSTSPGLATLQYVSGPPV